jgi:metal-responsive CopG/Arc/MetJ family transcriptional regulator
MMKTIQITIDEPLLARLDCAVAQEGSARSAFIRRAVERALFAAEEAERERQHREAYLRVPQSDDDLLPTRSWADGERWDP